jgi:hypothetical protein
MVPSPFAAGKPVLSAVERLGQGVQLVSACLAISREPLRWPRSQMLGEKIPDQRTVAKRHIVADVVAAFE